MEKASETFQVKIQELFPDLDVKDKQKTVDIFSDVIDDIFSGFYDSEYIQYMVSKPEHSDIAKYLSKNSSITATDFSSTQLKRNPIKNKAVSTSELLEYDLKNTSCSSTVFAKSNITIPSVNAITGLKIDSNVKSSCNKKLLTNPYSE